MIWGEGLIPMKEMKKKKEVLSLSDWEEGVFGLLSSYQLSNLHISHILHIFIKCNSKTNVGMQSVIRVIV